MVGRFTTVSFLCRCTRGRGISCEEPDIILGLEFKKWGSRCRCGCPELREVLHALERVIETIILVLLITFVLLIREPIIAILIAPVEAL